MATSDDKSVPNGTEEPATKPGKIADTDEVYRDQAAGEEAESGAGYGNHAAEWPPIDKA